MITEALIINFFEGKCDAQDAALVQAWLNDNPAKLKEFLGVEEWEDFRPAYVLSPEISGKLWNNINKSVASPTVRYTYLRWVAVAASLLSVVGLSWHFILKKQETGIISAATVAIPRNISNNTPEKRTLTLSDGSTVELLPNSTLSYPENFNSLKRDVILNGEATFNIAKNVAKPFSVHSNSVLITVLGTRFTVNSYENATKVILQEGKIMVKISDSSSRDDKKEYYLSPGDIFIYKKENKPSPVIDAKPIAASTSKGVSNDSSPARILHLEKDKDDRYVFNNYPLDVVFDQLQIIYNRKIIYNKAELGNRTFIGKVDQRDSLAHILKSITLLTDFGLQKQGDSFIIGN